MESTKDRPQMNGQTDNAIVLSQAGAFGSTRRERLRLAFPGYREFHPRRGAANPDGSVIPALLCSHPGKLRVGRSFLPFSHGRDCPGRTCALLQPHLANHHGVPVSGPRAPVSRPHASERHTKYSPAPESRSQSEKTD